jgi:hypothetical protein
MQPNPKPSFSDENNRHRLLLTWIIVAANMDAGTDVAANVDAYIENDVAAYVEDDDVATYMDDDMATYVDDDVASYVDDDVAPYVDDDVAKNLSPTDTNSGPPQPISELCSSIKLAKLAHLQPIYQRVHF